MKFITFIFALLLSIKLCLKKINDKNTLDSSLRNPSLEMTFIENNLKMKKSYLSSQNLFKSLGGKGYKMKLTFFKETDDDKTAPVVKNGIVKLGLQKGDQDTNKKLLFFIFELKTEKLVHQFSFLK